MKILFIITQSEIGGAQRWLFDVTTNLDPKKYQISVASQPGPLLNRLQKNKIRTHRLNNLVRNISPLRDLFGLIELYRLIKKERPDIVQLCSTKAGLLGSLAGKLARSNRIIYRIGGWSFNDPRPQWQNNLFLWLEKISAPWKDLIIVNSQQGYDEALKYKICSKNKLRLLYNGIDYSKYKYNLENKSDVLRIGVIANFYPTKGLAYLIKSLTQLKASGVKTLIIGEGKERSKLEQLVKDLDINNCILAGSQSDPWQYFEQQGGIDIFVIPSVKEGVPYVLLEAMANSLAIIATKVGGIGEIIKDHQNGLLIPSKNTTKITQAIDSLIKNKNLREKLGNQAGQDVKKYDLQSMIDKYSELLS
jgi:glycosyltransferase involved in cell wall biosynthesis